MTLTLRTAVLWPYLITLHVFRNSFYNHYQLRVAVGDDGDEDGSEDVVGVMITEKAFVTGLQRSEQREKLAEMMFETFSVRNFSLQVMCPAGS